MDKSEIILAELERLIYEPFQQNNQVSEKIGKVIAKSYDLLKEHTESVFRFQNDISAGYLYPYMISSNFFNGKLLESKSDFEERESVTYYNGTPFLNCKIVLLKIIQNYDFADIQKGQDFYEVEVITQSQSIIKRIAAIEIRKCNWLCSIGGVSFFNVELKKHFQKFIEEKIQNFSGQTLKIYSKTGWKKLNNKNWKYLHPQGVIGDSTNNILVNCGWKLKVIDNNIAQKYTEDRLLSVMCNMTGDNDTVRIVFLYSMLSLLATFYEESGVPLKFMIAIIGASGTRKTSLAKAITQSIWNDPKGDRYCNFQTSVAGVEMIISRCVDSVTLIDDYRPVCDTKARQNQNEVFEMACRMFGDATGKKRNTDFMTGDKTVVNYRARGGGVMTGEKMNREVSSSVARMLICYLKSDSVNTELLSWLQDNDIVYTAFVYKFLMYATDNANNIIDYLHKNVPILRKKFLEEVNQAGNNRYAEYFAQLICGKNLIIDYLKISLAFQNKNCIKKLDEAFTIAIEMCMKRNVFEVTPVNISAQILESICWAINSKSVLIEYLSEKICSDKADIYIADEIIYIVKSSLYHIIDRYTKYTGIKVDVIDLSDVIRILRDNNVLMTKLEGGKIVDAVKRPIKGMPDGRRFVMIRKSMLLSEGGYGNE